MIRHLIFMSLLLGLVACGSSKSGFDSGPIPPGFDRRQKPVPDKDTLVLKNENLQLTHFTQTWKLNNLQQLEGADKYLRVRKTYPFPIQFIGWVTLDNVESHFKNCPQETELAPVFILEDDHNGAIEMKAGDKIPVTREKLYDIRVELENPFRCQSIDVQFGVLYGTNE